MMFVKNYAKSAVRLIRTRRIDCSTVRSTSQSSYFERKQNQELNRRDEPKDDDRERLDQLFKSKQFSRSSKHYDTHQPLNAFQTILLAVGSSFGALVDPYRDGNYISKLLFKLTTHTSFHTLIFVLSLHPLTLNQQFIVRLHHHESKNRSGCHIVGNVRR